MKVSEKLSEIKQLEGTLNRIINLRNKLIEDLSSRDFSELKIEDIKKYREEKLIEQKKQLDELNNQIDAITNEICDIRNKINIINVSKGIDKKLIEIKHIRIELSRLMKLSQSYGMNFDKLNKLDFETRIKQLENIKNKLDAEIQYINWNTDYSY